MTLSLINRSTACIQVEQKYCRVPLPENNR
ncbi:hypothetical protein WN66_01726 [Saccharomyces cerevisiae]|nr:hypothetical protein WN66_01726 [Saccharomyces cerevisiae]